MLIRCCRFISRTSENSFRVGRAVYITQSSAFQLLKNPNNYSVENIDSILDNLSYIGQDCMKEKKNVATLMQIPAMKSFISIIPGLINSFSTSQTASFMKSMSLLKISDEEIWSRLEKHIIYKLHKNLTPTELSIIIESSSRLKRKSQTFWEKMEDLLINSVYSHTVLDEDQLMSVSKSFLSMKIGSNLLYTRIKENFLQIIDSLKPLNLVSLATLLANTKHFDEQVLSAVINSSEKHKTGYYGRSLQDILCCLVKAKAPESVITEYESLFLEKISTMNLTNLSLTAFVYGKFYGKNLISEGKKRELMKAIEKKLGDDFEQLITRAPPKELDQLLVFLFWGLSAGKVVNNLKLWKKFSEELEKNEDYMKNFPWYANEIKVILKSERII